MRVDKGLFVVGKSEWREREERGRREGFQTRVKKLY